MEATAATGSRSFPSVSKVTLFGVHKLLEVRKPGIIQNDQPVITQQYRSSESQTMWIEVSSIPKADRSCTADLCRAHRSNPLHVNHLSRHLHIVNCTSAEEWSKQETLWAEIPRGTEKDIAFEAIIRVCNRDRLCLEGRVTDMVSVSRHNKDTDLHVDDPGHS